MKPSDSTVKWAEGAERRGYTAEYAEVGALPGVDYEYQEKNREIKKLLSQCVLLSNKAKTIHQDNDHAEISSLLLMRMLSRGAVPFPTLGVEKEALREYRLLSDAEDMSQGKIETGYRWKNGKQFTDPAAIISALTLRKDFRLDPEADYSPGSDSSLLQSRAEAYFIRKWVPENIDPAAGHWFTPQAPLDRLLNKPGARRVDFLFNHPGGSPFVVEIDGDQHKNAAAVDRKRDRELRSGKISVYRVSVEELRRGRGKNLDRIKELSRKALDAYGAREKTGNERGSFILACATAAKVQYSIARAIGYGWLKGGSRWEITISGLEKKMGKVASQGVADLLRMLSGLEILYGGRITPDACVVRVDECDAVAWVREEGCEWTRTGVPEAGGDKISILAEPEASVYHALDDRKYQPDIVIRPAYLPVKLAWENPRVRARRKIVPNYRESESALSMFLQNIFRKCGFREMQGEALHGVLRQEDRVVLLPTGAGKSIIYQLAGLLMPGITLVVDPIISLMDDQILGLANYGIDRAGSINSTTARERRKEILENFAKGEYKFLFLSPERMQSPEFRQKLQSFAASSIVNLAVIDEAHCVSEWGHDFRPSYLNLAKNLRRHCSDPPVLALTGTASRAVLRDMFSELDIDRNRSDVLIRPESFNRANLKFSIRKNKPKQAEISLKSMLSSLPEEFGVSEAEFFSVRGDETCSGIVFVQRVKKEGGINDTARAVREATESGVTSYSGSPPEGKMQKDWDEEKRGNADDFRRNRAPVLVSTKAFGMGIDKPNIRWTAHFGMPSSIENFYQEAGRAGRDRGDALCVIIFSELDARRSDSLLDPNIDFAELKKRFKKSSSYDKRDDIMTAVWFHCQAFEGIEREVGNIETLLREEIGDISSTRKLEIPFPHADQKRKQKERSLIRLSRIGLVSDYEVDYGAKKYNVTVGPFNLEKHKNSLIDYWSRVQPEKASSVRRELARTVFSAEKDPTESVLELASLLVNLGYDFIERSRRRMIQEMVLMCRHSGDDMEIRKRLLGYFSENVGAEALDELLDSPEMDFRPWWERFEKIEAMDMGAQRGLAARRLEDHPERPELLLMRAITESMCSDSDSGVIMTHIAKAIRVSIHYGVSVEEIESQIVEKCFNLARTRAAGLEQPLALALFSLGKDGLPETSAVSETGMRRARNSNDRLVRLVASLYQVETNVDQLEIMVQSVIGQFKSTEAEKMLIGKQI